MIKVNRIGKSRVVFVVASLVAVLIIVIVLVGFSRNNADQKLKVSEKTHETKSSDSKMAKNHAPNMQPCVGNEESQCPTPPSIDFYPSIGEGSFNTSFDRRYKNIKEIGGKIAVVNGNNLELQTSDGKTFTISFPVNAVDEWNSQRSPSYHDYKVGIGDTLIVRYGEAKEQSSRTIAPSQIMTSAIAIRLTIDGKIERF